MLKLRLLDTADLRAPDGRAIRSVLAQPKRLALLAYLALAPGYCRRDRLTALFWPDVDQERARQSLRQSMYYLRRSLGAELIVGRGDEEVGLADGAIECDATEFRKAIAAGEWEQALGGFTGELLPGFYLTDAPEFERWLEAERSQIRSAGSAAAAQLASLAEGRGDPEVAVRWLKRQLELVPADEVVLRRLLELQDGLGDRAGALQTYAAAADHLRLCYDVEPSAETRGVVEFIRRRDSPLHRVPHDPPLPAGSAAKEMAPHRPYEVGRGTAGGAPIRTSRLSRPTRLSMIAALLLVVLAALPVTREALADLTSPSVRDTRASVAVLPIVDIGPDATAEYLGDGLTDELISVLGQAANLSVSSRTSSYSFKGATIDVREIGRRLGVRHVLEGSVREDRGRVRITIRLIDVADGRQLWSEIYDRAMGDVLAVQAEIGQSVVSALQGTTALGSGREVPVSKPATSSAAAYDDYLRGRYLLRDRSRQRVEGSIALFTSAIEKDPEYSLAYAALAEAQIKLANYIRPETVLPLAKQAAEKALSLNDELAETHLALAFVLLYHDWDWLGAEHEFRRAVELDPTLPSVHYGYAEYLKAARREGEMLRAIRRGLAAERAETVDPIGFAEREHAVLASAYLAAREYERALEHAQSAVDLNPGSAARFELIRASIATGDLVRAAAELERMRVDRGGRAGEEGRIGRAWALVGKREESLAILRSLLERSRREYVPQDQIGTVYLGLGDMEQALTAFESAVEDRHWFVVHLNSDPIFDPLRGHPRFQKLLERIHAPEA